MGSCWAIVIGRHPAFSTGPAPCRSPNHSPIRQTHLRSGQVEVLAKFSLQFSPTHSHSARYRGQGVNRDKLVYISSPPSNPSRFPSLQAKVRSCFTHPHLLPISWTSPQLAANLPISSAFQAPQDSAEIHDYLSCSLRSVSQVW